MSLYNLSHHLRLTVQFCCRVGPYTYRRYPSQGEATQNKTETTPKQTAYPPKKAMLVPAKKMAEALSMADDCSSSQQSPFAPAETRLRLAPHLLLKPEPCCFKMVVIETQKTTRATEANGSCLPYEFAASCFIQIPRLQGHCKDISSIEGIIKVQSQNNRKVKLGPVALYFLIKLFG